MQEKLDEFIKNGGVIQKIKPKKKGQKRSKFKKIDRYSKNLNNNIPLSELWFRNLYESKGYKLRTDKYNKPFKKYIPDLINFKFKYIIEIDGTFHNLKKQIKKDEQKNKFYISKGFKVFRILSHNIKSFNSNIKDLIEYRNLTSNSRKYKKTIDKKVD